MEVQPVAREYLDTRGVRCGVAFVLLWNSRDELLREVRELLREVADLLEREADA